MYPQRDGTQAHDVNYTDKINTKQNKIVFLKHFVCLCHMALNRITLHASKDDCSCNSHIL